MNLVCIQTTLVFILLATHVRGYSDIRETTCMSSKLSKITAERGEWDGGIEMTMKCDAGYDLPLNTPSAGKFRCLPDGHPWIPSYVPDCNKMSLPTGGYVVLSAAMTEARCKAVSAASGGAISLGPEYHSMTAADLCSSSSLTGCSLAKVIPACTGANVRADGDITTPANEFDHWANEVKPVTNLSHVVVILKVSIQGKTLKQLRDGQLLIKKNLIAKKKVSPDPGVHRSKLKAACPAGSIGVGNAGKIVCRGCSLAHYLDLATKSCRVCAPGHYQDEPLATKCKVCPTLANVAANDAKWAVINRKAPNRSFSLIYCPSIHENGSVVLSMKNIGRLKDNRVKPYVHHEHPGMHDSGVAVCVSVVVLLPSLLVTWFYQG